jgi:hypothetical protein
VAILLKGIFAKVPSTSREKQGKPAELKELKRTHSGTENSFIGTALSEETMDASDHCNEKYALRFRLAHSTLSHQSVPLV